MNENEKYCEYMQSIIDYRNDFSDEDLETAFIDKQCSFLVEQDVLQSYHIMRYDNTDKSCRIDAWGLRPAIEDVDSDIIPLVFILSNFHETENLETIPLSTFRSFLEKGRRFFLSCLKDSFRFDDLRNERESIKSFADYIYENKEKLFDITIIGITNKKIVSRDNTLVISEHLKEDFVFQYDVWDFCRYDKIYSSSLGRQSVDIDFVNDYDMPNGIKALTAETNSSNMTSYLFVMPGPVLYKMYEQWNERLLEQNPRTFLQFSTKVNKGLKNTLNKNPDCFFCYNNGLTAVASNVNYNKQSGSITNIDNFQIVNGGQTTAAIFNCARNAKKKKQLFFLDKVFVMVKMTVISDSEKALEMIPKISEYSNTQNKVSSSAFSIHHEYHKQMEKFSREIWTPAPSGQETHWYYERVQGQYKNAINLCKTQSEKKQFERQNPKQQMFKTVDLAKYIFAFDMKPDIVCKGSQKCYAAFCKEVLKADKDSDEAQKYDGSLNESLFRENCMKAMIFKALEKKQGNGVRFVSVPYIIACVTNNLKKQKLVWDFQTLWKRQCKDNDKLFNLLSSYDFKVLDKITSFMPENTKLLSEWAKKPDCWKILQNLTLDISVLNDFVISEDEYKNQKDDSKKDQKEINQAQAAIYCYEKGHLYWQKVKAYSQENRIYPDYKESGILSLACKPNTILSDRQAYVLIKFEAKVKKDGFEE